MLALRANTESGFTCCIGVGGIGAGIIYELDGEHELGRNESRPGKLLDARDYCKLHIIEHYISQLMGCKKAPDRFQVRPIGVVGDDEFGHQILNEMSSVGMDMRFVRTHPALKTLFSVCFTYPDGSGGNITSSNSAALSLTADDLKAAAACMKAAGPRGVALCVPEVPMAMRRQFLELASECGNYRASSFVLGEIQDAERMGLLELTDLLALNQEEASALFDDGPGHVLDDALLAERAAQFTIDHPHLRMIVSAGSKGAYGSESGYSQFCPAPVLQPISTAGAGDALLAGVVCGLAAGLPFIMPNERGSSFSRRVLQTALDLGVVNASFSVTSMHTIHPETTLANLLSFAESRGASISKLVHDACFEFERTAPEDDIVSTPCEADHVSDCHQQGWKKGQCSGNTNLKGEKT
jgi:sugar/nucleoside kinase (ribokinase family)